MTSTLIGLAVIATIAVVAAALGILTRVLTAYWTGRRPLNDQGNLPLDDLRAMVVESEVETTRRLRPLATDSVVRSEPCGRNRARNSAFERARHDAERRAWDMPDPRHLSR